MASGLHRAVAEDVAVRVVLIVACVMAMGSSAFAADYRDAPYRGRRAPVVYTGIRAAPPLYYVAAPPHYVQDLRTGAPGEWVVPEPSLFERLFGPLRGYN